MNSTQTSSFSYTVTLIGYKPAEVLYIEAIHYSVRDNSIIRELAAYVILGISSDDCKEILPIEVGENESSTYFLSVLNGLKNRREKTS